MRKIRISRRRRPANRRPESLSLDLRDHEITRAKQLAGRFGRDRSGLDEENRNG